MNETSTISPLQHPGFRFSSRSLLIPLLLGVFIRLIILIMADTVTTVGDENKYIWLGDMINKKGMYLAAWPPGYPFTIAFLLKLFGAEGIFILKLFQILCSAVIGYSIIRISHLIFGDRGARFSGYGWALYLPIAFFTHRIWPETLFLALFIPAMYLFLSYYLTTADLPLKELVLSGAGVLYGCALYFKEGSFYLFIFLVVLLFLKKPRNWSRTILFPLAVIVVLLPLTIRNFYTYGQFIPVGATLGINVHEGLNAHYQNYDYKHIPNLIKQVHQDHNGNWDFIYRTFIDYGPGWEATPLKKGKRRVMLLKGSKLDTKRAIAYALNHKKAFVLTRIKRIADFITPLSFLVRDLNPRFYSGILASDFIRRFLISISMISVMALLSIAWINLIHLRWNRHAFIFFVVIFSYFILTSFLISMSRFRLPIVPFLLVLLGGLAVRDSKKNKPLPTGIIIISGLVVMLSLWLLNLPEIVEVVAFSW